MASSFRLFPVRFRFRARDSISFPAGKAHNVVRGALGDIFRSIACDPNCTGVGSCPLRGTCSYARWFAPILSTGPSGFHDAPRPFVFRAGHLDGAKVEAGSGFYFDMHIFTLEKGALELFTRCFERLAQDGLGATRGRADLLSADSLSGVGSLVLPLDTHPSPVPRIVVRFETPTELKADGLPISEPHFPILFARVRDRVSTLRSLYGDGPLDLDFRAMGDRAQTVRMTRCDLRFHDVERRSSKTGQRHSIGGFTGEAQYEGDLREFLPYLHAAHWTGVGRQTVWGKGMITTLPASPCSADPAISEAAQSNPR